MVSCLVGDASPFAFGAEVRISELKRSGPVAAEVFRMRTLFTSSAARLTARGIPEHFVLPCRVYGHKCVHVVRAG